MWGKDDEARALLKELGTALAENEGSAGEWRLAAQTVAEPALSAVEERIFKEERILLPMSLQNLTETEWGEIFTQSPQFGYCLVDPRDGYQPPAPASDVPEAPGALSLDQLKAVFATLPVDITFVDAEDRVRFFSEGQDRPRHARGDAGPDARASAPGRAPPAPVRVVVRPEGREAEQQLPEVVQGGRLEPRRELSSSAEL